MNPNIRHIPRGTCDIHLHVAPSLIPRYCDIAEMAGMAKAAGYRAIVMKDHHSMTAPVTKLAQKLLFGEDSSFEIFGSLCLNNATGGLDPYTVEAAICWGAKVIWLPTCSAARHIQRLGTGGKAGFPGTAMTIHETPITLTDEGGRVKSALVDILKLIAQSPGTVLATGHASAEEINAVVEKAAELGVRKLVIDHPTFCVEATVEQIRHWVDLGAWIEHVGAICDPGTACYQTPESIARLIRETGVEHTLLSSDYGQKGLGDPVEGLDRFLGTLKDNGFTQAEIRTMCCENPARLLYH